MLFRQINIFCLFFVFAFPLLGQNETTSKKVHFIVHSDNPTVDINKYADALDNYGKLDQFRFYSKRRVIRFQKSNVSVELYSAKELFDLYKKTVSPFTIGDFQKYNEIEFALTSDGKSIKPQAKGKP